MSLRDLVARDTGRLLADAGGLGETATLRPRDAGPGVAVRIIVGDAPASAANGEQMLLQQRMPTILIGLADARAAIAYQEGAARDPQAGDVLRSVEGRLVIESTALDGLGFVVCQCRVADAIGAGPGRVL